MAKRERAQAAHRRLQELDALDGARRSVDRGHEVVFPVVDPDLARPAVDAGFGRLVDAELPVRPPRTPMDAVRRRLRRAGWTDTELDRVPDSWHLVGDVVLVKLPDELRDEAAYARALARSLGARTVLEDQGVAGERRTPRTRHVWGDQDTRTVHVERGVRYVLDPSRVMFSAGNVTERGRLLDDVAPDETVVDLFAGIGYFTLPLAVHVGCRVHACEVNPEAADFLRQGVEANGVADRVAVHEGDSREVAPRHTADRVLMGYVHGTMDLVSTARAALRPSGGTVHLHETIEVEDGPGALAQRAVAAFEAIGAEATVLGSRTVKTYAPRIVHAAVDLEVRP